MVNHKKILKENAGDPFVPYSQKDNNLLFALLQANKGKKLKIVGTSDRGNKLVELELVADGEVFIRAYNN